MKAGDVARHGGAGGGADNVSAPEMAPEMAPNLAAPEMAPNLEAPENNRGASQSRYSSGDFHVVIPAT